MSIIECAFTIRDESKVYYKGLYVTILSMFENTKSKINVHILHDETIEHCKDILKDLCNKYGHKIFFYEVPKFEKNIENTIAKWFNISVLYRLYLHELIDLDKILYLDSDLVINLDIKDMYDAPLEEHQLIAAVKDRSTYWDKRNYKKSKHKIEYLNLQRPNMFYSGGILLNLKKCRELSKNGNIFIQKTIQAVKDGVSLNYPDQDILNSVAHSIDDGIFWLDEAYTYCLFFRGRLYDGFEELKNKIVHYAGRDKPETILMPAQLLYWKYYAMSPFGGDVFEQMEKVFKTSSRMQIFRYYADNPKHRRHATLLLEGGLSKLLTNSITRLFKKK